MALIEIGVWQNKVEELKEEKARLNNQNMQLQEENKQLAINLEACSEETSNASIQKLKNLSLDLEEKNKNAQDLLDEFTQKKEIHEGNEKLIQELSQELIQIKSEFETYKKKTPDLSEKAFPIADSEKEPLENEIKLLKEELDRMKKDVIGVKKKYKVQEKEIFHLRKLLDIE
jgi:DNA repair exonuclease SbcCD ATPase subunit